MAEGLTWADVREWRLQRQFLAERPAPDVPAVIDRLGAVPARSGDATTAVGLRIGRPAGHELEAAVDRGTVFATYAFRGATHYLTARSAAYVLALRCAGRQWELTSWRTYYGLEPADWPGLRETVRDALRDGPLSQTELAARVTATRRYRHLDAAFRDRSHTLLKPFGWQGDLCFAPSADGAAFRLLDGLPGWTGLLPLDEAGPEAIRNYLGAYGPAGADRIHYWLGEGLSAGRRRIEGWLCDLGDELVVLTVEGTATLARAEDAEAITRTRSERSVRLLPGSDQWVLGPGTAAPEIVPPGSRALLTRGASPVLVGGLVSGTWVITGDVVELRWFAGVTPPAGGTVGAAVEALSRVRGRPLSMAG